MLVRASGRRELRRSPRLARRASSGRLRLEARDGAPGEDEPPGRGLRAPRLHLFVDARAAKGPATSVSDEWALWFQTNQARIESVNMLATSKFLQLVVSIVKLFSRTGEMIRMHADPEAFEASLRRLEPGFKLDPLPPR